jgi:hypothetical protein
MLTINGHEKQYFTSMSRVADYLDIAATTAIYNMTRNKTMTDDEGNTYKLELTDGSKVPYELINNFNR